jgi:flagellar secretion chaperone FliS
MAGGYGANQYKQTAVTTAGKGQILLMLYEAAIRNCKKAVECMEKKDFAGKGNAIGKVHDIVNELTTSLDHKVAGNIAGDLERLYNFMVEQLVKANMENAKEPVLQVQKLLETLLEGWKGAVEQFNKSGGKP